MKFTPMKRGEGKSCSNAEGGGHKQFWGRFYAVA